MIKFLGLILGLQVVSASWCRSTCRSLKNNLFWQSTNLLQTHGHVVKSFYDESNKDVQMVLRKGWEMLPFACFPYDDEFLQDETEIHGFKLVLDEFDHELLVYRKQETKDQVICFRGTANLKNIIEDGAILFKSTMFGMEKFYETLYKDGYLDGEYTTKFVGHSKGATSLVLFLEDLLTKQPNFEYEAYYFAPGVGISFSEYSKKAFLRALNSDRDLFFINVGDLIPCGIQNLLTEVPGRRDNLVFITIQDSFKDQYCLWNCCPLDMKIPWGENKVPVKILYRHFPYVGFMNHQLGKQEPWRMSHAKRFLALDSGHKTSDERWMKRHEISRRVHEESVSYPARFQESLRQQHVCNKNFTKTMCQGLTPSWMNRIGDWVRGMFRKREYYEVSERGYSAIPMWNRQPVRDQPVCKPLENTHESMKLVRTETLRERTTVSSSAPAA